ncbi:MAG: protein-glutamate O-methyltransferase CheR [Gemmatimonadota bacterium]|nr:protein-glutamate O-methyltransferase CheR [Gemmatimonadota bacterium]
MTTAVAWTTPQIERIAHLVCERTGLVFPATRRESVEEAVSAEMRRLGLADLARYRDVLASESAALDALVANLTIGETYFFREPSQLEVIRSLVIPELVQRREAGRVARVWSAACASGEEAYTLSIMLREQESLRDSRVIGTEISRERLAVARAARYGRWSLRGLDAAVIARHFDQRGEKFQLDAKVRASVEFRYLNLAEDVYPASSTGIWGMDLILCRNVLIYFDRATVKRVASRLVSSLADDGWLFLGASDPPIGELVPCEVVVTGAGLAYRKPGIRSVRRHFWRQVDEAPELEVVATETELAPSVEVPLIAEPAPEREAVAAPVVPSANDELEQRYAAREFDNVVALARRARETGRDDAPLWIMLVRALANLGRLADAGVECASALGMHRTNAELVYLHALLLSEAQRPTDAVGAVRRALYLDRGMTVAHLTLATLLARTGDCAGARRSFRTVEQQLSQMPPGAPVPASDGEPAQRLLEIARAQRTLLCGAAT